MLQVTADQHQLVLAFTSPVAVIDGEAFSGQMEHMTALTLLEPKNSLGAEHALRQLVVEEVLERSQIERARACE